MRDFDIIINGFGLQNVRTITYQAPEGGLEGRVVEYAEQQNKEVKYMHGGSSDATLTSWLGTPIFSDFRFQGNAGVEDLYLETVLIDVANTKNIVTTAITGRNGTIKEYVSDGDYVINIKGALTSQDNAYPLKDVRDLHNVLRQKKTLNIVSEFLRIFDIYHVVVTDFKFSQVEGMQNVQYFEINCISDIPYELIGKK